MALVRIGDAALPEFHQLVGAGDLAAVAVVDIALDAVIDVGRRHVEPLALADDGGEFVLVLHLLAPLLGLHDGHQHGHRRLGVLVDPVGAQAQRLLGMVLPDLAGHAGGVADILVDELIAPWLADAEGVHVADLHVGHHLRRRHDDGRDVLVRIDAAGGQPVADPHIMGAARKGHGALHFLAGGLLLGEGLLERRGIHGGACVLEFLGNRDRLAVVVEARQDIHRRRFVLRRRRAHRDLVGLGRQDVCAVDAARVRTEHDVVARCAPRCLLGDVGVGDAVFVEEFLFLGDDER